MTYIPLIHLH